MCVKIEYKLCLNFQPLPLFFSPKHVSFVSIGGFPTVFQIHFEAKFLNLDCENPSLGLGSCELPQKCWPD